MAQAATISPSQHSPSNSAGGITSADDFHKALHQLVGTPKHDVSIIRHGKRTIRKLKSRAHKADWSSATVNLQSRHIVVNIYLDLFQDEDMSDQEYKRVKQLTLLGIAKYWSRTFTLQGKQYTVQVNASERYQDSVTARLMYHKMSDTSDYVRSFNLGFWGLSNFVYNDWPGAGNRNSSDAEYMTTCAHEFGHSVLMVFGGASLSWSHKGSTHIIPLSVKSSTPGYPTSGEIDLMKYYDRNKQAVSLRDMAKRTIVSEQDVMRLIWISEIQF